MRAIALQAPGNVDQLAYIEIPKPVIQHGEVLIRVKTISINPVDVKTRAGKGVYGRIKTEDPLIIGWDVSGIIEESKSDLFIAGDEVFGMVNFPGHGKAYAEYVAAPADQLALKPGSISFEEAAAATLVALTAWQVLVDNANIKAGEKVLIHAASGGVGHIAIQIAKHLGAIVTGTSSAKNKEFILQLGADDHIDYKGYNWANQERTYDFVLDAIGGENIDNCIAVTKEGGSIISIPSGMSEALTEKAKLQGIRGYNMLVKSSGSDMKQIASLLEKKIIKAVVSQVFSFDQMAQAHLQQETGRTVGKLVISL